MLTPLYDRSSTSSKKPRLSEENYELLPRDAEWKEEMIDEDKVHYRLPLKSNEGLLPQDPVTLVDIIYEENERKEEGVVCFFILLIVLIIRLTA